MATILIAGNVDLFTTEATEYLAEHHTVVIAGEKAQYHGKFRNIYTYKTTPMEEKFGQLFDVYTFQAVWYVSGYLDGGNGLFGESQMLEQALLECQRSRVDKLILLSTIDSQNYLGNYGRNGELLNREYPNSRIFNAAHGEALGQYFMEKTGVKIITLWLPYLAGRVNDKNFLGQVFQKMCRKEKVMFPYHREDRIDFLSYRDLSDLLVQITDETEDDSGSYYVTSGYQYTYGDLEELLKLAAPDLHILYENYPCTITDWPAYPQQLRKKYGFVPMDNIMEDVGAFYRVYVNEVYNNRSGVFGKAMEKLRGVSGLYKYLEMIIIFLAAEIISHYTSDSVYFRFVDVRLFYIVIMGTIHGMRVGVLGAVLECLVLVREYLHMGMDSTLLFYNIENWIPFVIYLMAGSISGYVRDKNTEELQVSHEEYSLLRNKYIFLNDVYHGAIQNKGEFKRQILGFKDSFGKIFDAVQKLDNELPQTVFLEGLKVLEDILENRTVAIYTLDSWQRFGRLAVCSNSLLTKLTKSIRIEDYREMYDQVKTGEVWRNTELKEGVPMYACGVFQKNVMVLLITIQDVSPEQYGMHYINIFRILCGLVQTSFLRAAEYEELRQSQIMFPGGHVVRPEHMRLLVNVQEDMKEAGVADYVLVRFIDRDRDKLSEELTGLIRASDTLGAGEDGNLYLLLPQMTENNFQIVGQRLDSKGIKYRLAGGME